MKWARWLLLVALVGLVGYSGWRTYRAFYHQPELFGARERNSPGLPRSAWQQFDDLLKTARRIAGLNGQTIRSIQFVELTDDPKTAIFWNDVDLKNPGFNPLGNIEQQLGGREVEIIGFYTMAGEALSFTDRIHPKNPHHHIFTVHLNEPLAPGKSGMLLRRERRPLPVTTGADGVLKLGLGRLPVADAFLHVRAVRLADDATLVDYRPQPAEKVVRTDPSMVGWISGGSQTNAEAVSITFRRGK